MTELFGPPRRHEDESTAKKRKELSGAAMKAEPTPATHPILAVLKAGETVYWRVLVPKAVL